MPLARSLRRSLLYRMDSAVLAWLNAFVKRNKADESRVLLLRFDYIGDFVLFTDFSRGLREFWPDKEITIYANSTWSSLAETSGLYDRVIPLDRRRFLNNPFYRYRILSRIFRENYSYTINPVYSREFSVADACVRFASSANSIGFQGDSLNSRAADLALASRWYGKLVASTRRMELRKAEDFLHALGHGGFRARGPFLDRASALRELPEKLRGVRYILAFPFASWEGRLWPLDRFAALAKRAADLVGAKVVTAGGPADVGVAELFQREMGGGSLDLTGQLSLRELLAVVAGAELVLTNETSAAHIAAAVGTKSFCLLGGGHFGRFVPYDIDDAAACVAPVPIYHEMECFGCDWQCKFPRASGESVKCMREISLERALGEVARALGGRDGTG